MQQKIAFLFLCIIFSSLWISFPIMADSNNKVLFFKANQNYEDGQYREALESYLRLSAQEKNNGVLHYNLGNTYFRLGQLGKSIFHFRLASELLPGNGDILFNLNHARQQTIDKLPPPVGLSSSLKSSLNKLPLSAKDSLRLTAVLALVLFIFLVWTLFRPQLSEREWIKWSKIVLFIFFFASGIIAFIRLTDLGAFGVSTSAESKVFSSTGKDSVLLFTLHEGAEFKVTHVNNDNWVQIELNDNKRGWMEKKDLIYYEGN